MAAPRSYPPLSSAPMLPPGFKTVEEIRNLASDQIKGGVLVSVIGFVNDYQPPVPMRNGSDPWKCTFEIKDYSVQDTSWGLKVNIFGDDFHMPMISGVRDAVLIRKAKVQMWKGAISLIKNRATEFHVLSAGKIPRSPEVVNSPWQSTPGLIRKPNAEETRYVVLASSGIDEMGMPSRQEFLIKTEQAMNVKDKFSLLKDVKPDRFYNILGQVIKIFDGTAGTLTVYLSDYSPNSSFYHYAWDAAQDSDPSERDEYGNHKTKPKAAKEWPGPYGKMSIQLTLFDEHAQLFREKVKVEEWVLLSNVQMKFGKSGGCLEGFLRGDPNQYEGTVRVEVMKQKEEKEDNNPRWKDAIRRKLDYEKKFEKQKQELLDLAAGVGQKRKQDDEPIKKNSKQRRREAQAAIEEKVAASEAKLVEKLNLNENVRCNYPDIPTLSLSTLLQPQKLLLNGEDRQEVVLPFIAANYRANVRVVGYFPPRLEDFATGRRVSEYDMLSDYSGGEDSDPEEFNRSWKSGKGAPIMTWEWRFALEVEDASSKGPRAKMWLMVDNAAAEGLLNLDATNLRSRGGKDTLRELKEKLCILWGDLEEQKSASSLPASKGESKLTSLTLNTEPPSSLPPFKAGGQPSVDSDDENDFSAKQISTKFSRGSVLSERILNTSLTDASTKAEEQPVIHNKAFTCCIKQYGVKFIEKDASNANAGNGKRWERKFGLFGVTIL